MAALSGRLTRKLVENLGPGRHGDGSGLYLVVDPSRPRRWIVRVWLELHIRFNGGNNGRLTLSYAEAGDTLGMGKATVQRAYDDLVAHGFLALEKEGNWYHRRAHEWRLTSKPMQTPNGKVLATNDWHRWRPHKTERGSETEPSASSLVPFRNPKRRHGSE